MCQRYLRTEGGEGTSREVIRGSVLEVVKMLCKYKAHCGARK